MSFYFDRRFGIRFLRPIEWGLVGFGLSVTFGTDAVNVNIGRVGVGFGFSVTFGTDAVKVGIGLLVGFGFGVTLGNGAVRVIGSGRMLKVGSCWF